MGIHSLTILTPSIRAMRHAAALSIKEFLCGKAKELFQDDFPITEFTVGKGNVASHENCTVRAPGILLGCRDFPLRYLNEHATVIAEERTRNTARDKNREKVLEQASMLYFLPEGLFFFQTYRTQHSYGVAPIMGSGVEADPDAYLIYGEEVLYCLKRALDDKRTEYEKLELKPYHIALRELKLLRKRHDKEEQIKNLDLAGIKGYPGHLGYLDHLRMLKLALTDRDVGLMIYQVDREITESENHIAVFEKNPQSVKEYIAVLRSRINVMQMLIDPYPEHDEIESMRSYHKECNDKIKAVIEEIESEIKKYSDILASLIAGASI